MIRFEQIEIKYGDFVAIRDLNLHIKEGEFFTFLGPSGCGKTTSLRTLVGFITPSKGKIKIADKEVTHLPVEKREIGMVFQSYALFPTMSVYDNIAFGLRVQKLSKDEIDKKVRAVAAKIKITDEQLKKNVAALSGGQQQRVALARAIVLEPKILCLDEPLSNLDAKLRIDLRDELKRLQKEIGITTIYVTHDQEEALTLSDRIAVFNEGFLEQVGTPYEIYNHSASEIVCNFIGDINRLNPAAIRAVSQQTAAKLNQEKTGFVRIERCLDAPAEGYAKLECKVTDHEFSGVFTKYTLDCMGETIKYIDKNDGLRSYKKGDFIHLYINPHDIMQF